MRILANIYKDNGYDCSNNGISSYAGKVMLFWDIDENDKEAIRQLTLPMVELHKQIVFGTVYINATPLNEKRWCMFGGCFIYSCDSRFPSPYPIPLHDRIEEPTK